MIIRLLISLVTAGAVVGCQVEDTEQTSGTLNVDPNSEQEVPEWVTVRDLDHNRDGIIDIRDLVIISKFFGQEVPVLDMANASVAGEPKVCQDIRAGILSGKDIDFIPYQEGSASYARWERGKYPKIESEGVDDTTNYTEKFISRNGGTYSYALLLMSASNVALGDRNKPVEESAYLSCFAVRIHYIKNNNFTAMQLKIKPVAIGHSAIQESFPESLTSPLMVEEYEDCGRVRLGEENGWYAIRYANDEIKNPSVKCWLYKGDNAPIFNYVLKNSVPIGDTKVFQYLGFNFESYRNIWAVAREFDVGLYLKMLPAEVRAKYFREDIEATGN